MASRNLSSTAPDRQLSAGDLDELKRLVEDGFEQQRRHFEAAAAAGVTEVMNKHVDELPPTIVNEKVGDAVATLTHEIGRVGSKVEQSEQKLLAAVNDSPESKLFWYKFFMCIFCLRSSLSRGDSGRSAFAQIGARMRMSR